MEREQDKIKLKQLLKNGTSKEISNFYLSYMRKYFPSVSSVFVSPYVELNGELPLGK